MLLKNEFEVDSNVEQAWNLLTDLERIAPCMPGATLDRRNGEEYRGTVKVKVGPITAQFAGSAAFTEMEHTAYRAVIAASGKDPRGQAAASAQIRAQLKEITPFRTRVVIDTDLDISGRIAQFGRGAIADVSNRLLTQFATNINEQVRASPDAGAATTVTAGTQTSAAPAGAAAASEREASVDAMALVIPMIKERYGQAIAGGLLGFLLSWLVFGRKVRK